jgi:hypothetical protein
VPFLRFSRDKRGYEHTYLCETVHRRGKPARTKILYWFRSPPSLKVGRPPFDDEVRKTLEAQNPGVRFDWPTIIATPMPAPEPEPWWEKRRAERQARQARRADDIEETPEPVAVPEPEMPRGTIQPAADVPLAEPSDDELADDDEEIEVIGESSEMAAGTGSDNPGHAALEAGAGAGSDASPGQSRSGRRRRRGGRRRRGQRPAPPAPPGESMPREAEAALHQEQKSESRAETTETPPPSSEG